MLALGSWTVLVAALLPGLVADPAEFGPYHWLVFASAMLGLVGGLLWVVLRPGWKVVIALAACCYLVVITVRFFAVSVWWQLDFGSTAEAVQFALWFKWQLLQHHFSHGRLVQGIGATYYELLMPVLQGIVLLGLVATYGRLRHGVSRFRGRTP